MIQLDPSKTALVVIDLQKGILGRELQPRPASEVAGVKIVWVTVAWDADYGDALKSEADEATPRPPGGFPTGFSELIDGLAAPGDLHVRKRQWGAFYGTDLDLQLRRRGIDTILLGGVATNYGVESTARDAWERGYGVVILEDLCATMTV
jgi:nicotinamidase-related amidase